MKVTKITAQVKQAGRYSIFVDDVYAFSLSETALLESKLTNGQELTKEQLTNLKQLSADDKLYQRALSYAVMRPRSIWEMRSYLERKDSPAPLIEQITNKLIDHGYLDDKKFAEAFVHDHRLFRSASTRKLTMELRKKRVSSDVIEQVLAEDETDESALLQELVEKKRQLTKYRTDDLKLMQYLARQGFSYGDIKAALERAKQDTPEQSS